MNGIGKGTFKGSDWKGTVCTKTRFCILNVLNVEFSIVFGLVSMEGTG